MSTRSVRLSTAAAATLIALMPTVLLAAKPPSTPYVYGPDPDWTRYRALGEEAIRAQMIDPESARFRWPNGYKKSGYRPLLSAKVYGYATCGYVNGRNRLGGYVGEKPFIMVIDHDSVAYSEIGQSESGIVGQACNKVSLPPASEMAGATTPEPGPGALGLRVSSVPDGAYVSEVAPDGAAQAAGLKPGLVIVRINGIETRGLPITTVQQVLGAARGRMTLNTIDGHDYTLALAGTTTTSTVKPGDEP